MPPTPIVTFTSDFGTREPYVAAVKGAILSVLPTTTIVDITHDIGAHDLIEAAFVLSCAYPYFPSRTVHLVVVDPTVGSARRAIVVSTENQFFVAPDNGVLSLVYRREPSYRVIAIEAEHYFRRSISPTFHGRDILGPVAGWLARGADCDNFGPEVRDYVRLGIPSPQKVADKRYQGIVLHIDRFGNIITNISHQDLTAALGAAPVPDKIAINGKEIARHYRFYAEASGEELFSVVGSSGFYEVAAFRKPASRMLDARRGHKVELELA